MGLLVSLKGLLEMSSESELKLDSSRRITYVSFLINECLEVLGTEGRNPTFGTKSKSSSHLAPVADP